MDVEVGKAVERVDEEAARVWACVVVVAVGVNCCGGGGDVVVVEGGGEKNGSIAEAAADKGSRILLLSLSPPRLKPTSTRLSRMFRRPREAIPSEVDVC